MGWGGLPCEGVVVEKSAPSLQSLRGKVCANNIGLVFSARIGEA